MKETEEITEAFALIVELAEARNVQNLAGRDGCWEMVVDENWRFAVNGHRVLTKAFDEGVDVPPFEAYVEWNGWPAGFVGPFGGVLAAGEAANEETFCAALRQRINAERQ